MKSALPFALVALLLAACGGSPHEGFKHVGNDVHLRLHVLGDGETLAADGDSILLRFRAAELEAAPGSYVSFEQWYAAEELRSGAMQVVLTRLHTGDSASVIAPSDAWPWHSLTSFELPPRPAGPLRVELAMLDLRTEAAIKATREQLQRDDPEGYERRLVEAFLKHDARRWTRWGTSDLYYEIKGVAADTNALKAGDRVTLSWVGRSLEDGVVFDDTDKHVQAFSYLVGQPDQVIEGLAVAVHLMREGQHGDVLIPSSMAFGGKGVPGVVEPHAPVLYTVRIGAVERRRS
ncbi:MAG: FKBP-type peptidyl-prolyl cis-trans isomerase [Flavobacteriales bacterium]|nr:FKBP-type peptidyl-prolyl cis-trans isomerase [Flavobacteriales bacterium]